MSPSTRALLDLTLIVNGTPRHLRVPADTTLLTALRETLQLTGTKAGCERGECGACTVLVDGQTRLACLTLAHQVAGREVLSIEGLAQGGALSPLQRAFHEHLGAQCGFCTPGMIMAAAALLKEKPRPTDADIDAAITNLCRCGTYPAMRAAIKRAAELKKAGA